MKTPLVQRIVIYGLLSLAVVAFLSITAHPYSWSRTARNIPGITRRINPIVTAMPSRIDAMK